MTRHAAGVTKDAEDRLGRFARDRGGIFTRGEARLFGVPAATISSRMSSGLWVPELGGLRAATTPVTPTGRYWAALAHAGPRAALSHLSAAQVWGLAVPGDLGPDGLGDVWLTVPRSRSIRSRPGLRVVRTQHLPALAVRERRGLPVLTAARTIVDLALVWNAQQLTAAALAGIQRGLCGVAELRAWHRVFGTRPGAGLVTRVLEELDPAFESILAAEFGALAQSAGLGLVPGYRVDLPDGGFVVCDFADPAARLDFEVDGLAYHSNRAQVARDKARDRRLSRAGWLTVRYDTDNIRRAPQATIEDARQQQLVRRALFLRDEL